MAAPANTFVMRDGNLMIEDVDYTNQVWKSRLVPDVPMIQQRTLVPDGTIVDVDSAVWTFELTLAQINKTGGLAKVLRDADPGTEMDVVFIPHDTGAGSPKATFTIVSMPGPFGGDQGALADNELVFPVKGSPVFAVSS